MVMALRRRIFGFLLALAFCVPGAVAKEKIFVAASLIDLMEALRAEAGLSLQIVPGGSSSLARQIKAGAPAALYISAHKDWAGFVAEGRETTPLFANALVLASAQETKIEDITQLPELLTHNRLAMAHHGHVPAGIYGREALEYLGIWAALQVRVASYDNVRAAARAVKIGAVPYGVVYTSDAKALGLNIVYQFAAESHAEIRYWGVILEKDNQDIEQFIAFLKTEQAEKIIARYGFRAADEF